MAEGLLRKYLGAGAVVMSCGLSPVEPNDFMISVMSEVDIDMSVHTPASIEEMKGVKFDRIIAFTEAAKAGAEEILDTDTTKVEIWPVSIPVEGSLDVRAMFNNYREIRSDISARIQLVFG